MGFSPIIQVFFLRFSGFFSQKWASTILFEIKPETHQEKPPEFQGDKPIIQVNTANSTRNTAIYQAFWPTNISIIFYFFKNREFSKNNWFLIFMIW